MFTVVEQFSFSFQLWNFLRTSPPLFWMRCEFALKDTRVSFYSWHFLWENFWCLFSKTGYVFDVLRVPPDFSSLFQVTSLLPAMCHFGWQNVWSSDNHRYSVTTKGLISAICCFQIIMSFELPFFLMFLSTKCRKYVSNITFLFLLTRHQSMCCLYYL